MNKLLDGVVWLILAFAAWTVIYGFIADCPYTANFLECIDD